MKDTRDMNDEEYERLLQERERLMTATVNDLVGYLQTQFKLDDKLCWIDCVEGVKYEARPLIRTELGEKLFRRVEKTKENEDIYCYVGDGDVLVN